MEEADALGYALVHHFGVKPGDRVGIAMRNYPEWIISFAAILSIGAISVSMNAWWTAPEMEYAINDARTVGHDRRHRAHRTRRRRVPTSERARCSACASTRWRRSAPDVEHWSDVVVRGVAMPEVELSADMDATILYTSGTTGFPKGAVSTHGTIMQTVFAFSSRAAVVGDASRARGLLGAGLPPCLHLDRAALSRHGLHPGHDDVLQLPRETRDDVSLGAGARPATDRASPGDELRRACRRSPGTSWSRRTSRSTTRRRWPRSAAAERRRRRR